MRSTIKYDFKGVATMRFFVAVFLVLTMFSSGAVTLGQNPPRRTTDKSAQPAQSPQPTQPKADTIKICQGVPIPDGYVVVAYLTSTACEHGAYLLKKQNGYESSLAVNGDARQPVDQTTPARTLSAITKANPATSPRAGSAGP